MTNTVRLTLSLDVANLQAVTSVAVGDRPVAIQDLTNSNATRKVTLDDVFTTFASTGIGALAGGGHFLDLTEIVTITALAAGDEVVLSDDSNSDVARRSTLTTLGAFAGGRHDHHGVERGSVGSVGRCDDHRH